MFGFLPTRWQGTGGAEKRGPSWFDRRVSPILLSIAKKACTHPIHTIVVIAFLASYSYLGALEKGLLDGTDKALGQVDFETLLAGSKRLRVGQETSWKWEVEDDRISTTTEQVRLHRIGRGCG
jgi:hydroxymethylglutaryl-CoA reductase (NADPH)